MMMGKKNTGNELRFRLIVILCAIVYSYAVPGPSSDTVPMRQYKKALETYLKTGVKEASATDIFKATPFMGQQICMAYVRVGKVHARDTLKSWFPDKEAEIDKLKLRTNRPQLLVAITTPSGLIILSGYRSVYTPDQYVLAMEDQTGEANPHEANRCIDFQEASFRKLRKHVVFPSGNENDVDYLVLSKKK